MCLAHSPFDLLARSVLAGNAAYEIEMPLSFFRHGLIDLRDRQYIEAIYDFYFVLDTMCAEGTFKARDQKKAFEGRHQGRYKIVARANSLFNSDSP
jgi:hypothetical protein